MWYYGAHFGAQEKWGEILWILWRPKSIAVQIVQGLPFTAFPVSGYVLRGMGFDKSHIDCDIENLKAT